MLALLRRYISAPEEQRDPHLMIEEFKAAHEVMRSSSVRSLPLRPEADRPAPH
jgi:hypothetical protein